MDTSKYNLDTMEGIRAVPVPTEKIKDDEEHIEYQLMRKATEHKRNGEIDLAIECLKKAREIMPFSGFTYSKEDYLRLPNYLKEARRFDEAAIEEKKVFDLFGASLIRKDIIEDCHKKALLDAESIGTDLVEATHHSGCCPICAKYRGRIFSISGKNTTFPKLPEDFLHECLSPIYIFPYFEGSCSAYDKSLDVVAYSNRPFEDDRTQEEKEQYSARLAEKNEMEADRADYDWIWQYLPEQCPKSFSSYRRMKKAKSASFLKLQDAASKAGRDFA